MIAVVGRKEAEDGSGRPASPRRRGAEDPVAGRGRRALTEEATPPDLAPRRAGVAAVELAQA